MFSAEFSDDQEEIRRGRTRRSILRNDSDSDADSEVDNNQPRRSILRKDTGREINGIRDVNGLGGTKSRLTPKEDEANAAAPPKPLVDRIAGLDECKFY
jgi:hypothetical protein